MSNQHHAPTFTKRVLLISAMMTGLGFAIPATSHANYDVYVSVPGIQGDSTDARYPGQIVASSFSWGAVRKDSATTTAPTVAPFTITKALDRASVLLAMAVIKGNTYTPVVVTITTLAGGMPAVLARFTLSNARVVVAHTVGIEGGVSVPVEEVQFSFTGMTMAYYAIDYKTGKSLGVVSASW